jgi:hypothetical protein
MLQVHQQLLFSQDVSLLVQLQNFPDRDGLDGNVAVGVIFNSETDLSECTLSNMMVNCVVA